MSVGLPALVIPFLYLIGHLPVSVCQRCCHYTLVILLFYDCHVSVHVFLCMRLHACACAHLFVCVKIQNALIERITQLPNNLQKLINIHTAAVTCY